MSDQPDALEDGFPPPRRIRIAVVGAGPSGLFAVQALLAATAGDRRPDLDLAIDVYDRLPTPFGLLRYGVAPDHVGIKRVAETLARVFDTGRVRFVGNVELGRDVTADQLRRDHHAVIYALGASGDAHLGVPGEALAGSLSAREFVAWYDGHPDAAPIDLHGVRTAVVVGVGNVAVDVARVLLKPTAELSATDIPDPVLDRLAADRVAEVVVVGRRGPRGTAFTPVELRELVGTEGVDVVVEGVRPGELDPERPDPDTGATPDRRTVQLLTAMSEAHDRVVAEPRARLRLLFWHRPMRIDGVAEVGSIRLEATEAAADGRVTGAERFTDLECQLVLRAIGYRGRPLPDLPFDQRSGTIPNQEGRVVDEHGRVRTGEYAVGWIKRGAVGVIGTNKSDAAQTVAHLLDDLAELPDPETADLPGSLRGRGVVVADFAAWLRIDAAEVERGRRQGRVRTKIETWSALTDLIMDDDRG